MTPWQILLCVGLYFTGLLVIAYVTSRRASNAAYFIGNKASPWYAVAFGLIGDSLSGVTFISVPGAVAAGQFAYLQIVLGYIVGYILIAAVLLPLYYRLYLVSIYGYLETRYGTRARKTGAFFFLLSRTLGAAARLFLAANVFQLFVFNRWGIPFAATVSVIILLILIYTFKGGIKTLVWTDTFQSTFLLLGLVFSVGFIIQQLNLDLAGVKQLLWNGPHSKIFFLDPSRPRFFGTEFLAGAFIAVAMTGLDQNMMQKNLSCRTLQAAQKNMYSFTVVMVLVNVLFVSLGALLFEFVRQKGLPIPARTDELFPTVALTHLGVGAALFFVLGLTAATFSSADSVLTTLTTSFCLDFLRLDSRTDMDERSRTHLRKNVHLAFAGVLWLAIIGFQFLNSTAVIDAVLKIAGYTYGPLLGLFAFGLLSNRRVQDSLVPAIALAAPLLCLAMEKILLSSWQVRLGNELLIWNGGFTFLGLILLSRPANAR